MVKQLLFLLLILTGPLAFTQRPEADAAALKNRRSDLWYTDSSFVHPAKSTLPDADADTARKRTTSINLLRKITGPLGYLIGALILGALTYAFYNFTKTPKPQKTGSSKGEPAPIETPEDLHQTDFTSGITAAEAGGNFRLALRYHYLQLLQEFSRQSLIRYEKNKTNKQYASEIKNHKWGPDFLLATRYYNFTWYGEHPLNEETYRQLAAHFKKMPPYE